MVPPEYCIFCLSVVADLPYFLGRHTRDDNASRGAQVDGVDGHGSRCRQLTDDDHLVLQRHGVSYVANDVQCGELEQRAESLSSDQPSPLMNLVALLAKYEDAKQQIDHRADDLVRRLVLPASSA